MTWKHVATVALALAAGTALVMTGHDAAGSTLAGMVIAGVFAQMRPGDPPPPPPLTGARPMPALAA